MPDIVIAQLRRDGRHGGSCDPILDSQEQIFGPLAATIDSLAQIARLNFARRQRTEREIVGQRIGHRGLHFLRPFVEVVRLSVTHRRVAVALATIGQCGEEHLAPTSDRLSRTEISRWGRHRDDGVPIGNPRLDHFLHDPVNPGFLIGIECGTDLLEFLTQQTLVGVQFHHHFADESPLEQASNAQVAYVLHQRSPFAVAKLTERGHASSWHTAGDHRLQIFVCGWQRGRGAFEFEQPAPVVTRIGIQSGRRGALAIAGHAMASYTMISVQTLSGLSVGAIDRSGRQFQQREFGQRRPIHALHFGQRRRIRSTKKTSHHLLDVLKALRHFRGGKLVVRLRQLLISGKHSIDNELVRCAFTSSPCGDPGNPPQAKSHDDAAVPSGCGTDPMGRTRSRVIEPHRSPRPVFARRHLKCFAATLITPRSTPSASMAISVRPRRHCVSLPSIVTSVR